MRARLVVHHGIKVRSKKIGVASVQCAGEVGVAAVVEWQGTREAGVSSTLILI